MHAKSRIQKIETNMNGLLTDAMIDLLVDRFQRKDRTRCILLRGFDRREVARVRMHMTRRIATDTVCLDGLGQLSSGGAVGNSEGGV